MRDARSSSTSATAREQAARGLAQSGLGCPTWDSPTSDTAQTTHTHTRTLLPACMYNKYVLPHLPTPTHETRV